MDGYYIYNKYVVNKLTTLSFYQKSFINSNIVKKKTHVLIQLQNSNWLTKNNK